MPFAFAQPAGWFVCLLPTLLLPVFPLAAQSLAPVSGMVSAQGGAAIEAATVTLHRATDSVAVKTEFSGADGRFSLLTTQSGRYLVSVVQLGYARAWAGPVEVSTATVPPLTVVLVPSAVQLKGVTVTAQKPLFERLPDRTIVNVENSSLASGNTALDVLSRAPGVTVGINDNLALRGKEGVLVLLDGKRVPVTGVELAALLRSLPAEQVQTIELITSPPAKYDAQGGAGIIAINLKKDQRLGTNGTTNISYGRGRYGKLNAGLSLNHRNRAFNFYGSYSYTNRNGFQNLAFSRNYLRDARLISSSTQYNARRVDLQSHTWKTGIDYTASPRTTLGVMLSGLGSRLPVEGNNSSTFFDSANQPTLGFVSRNESLLRTPNVAGNLTFRRTFPLDSGRTAELTADADVARYGTDRDLSLTTNYLFPGRAPRLLTSSQDGSLTIQSVKTDYVRPLPDGVRLEAGLKTSWVRSNNDVLFYNTIADITTLDVNQSNGFRYQENINAGYFSVSRTQPKLTVTAGLRAEQTNTAVRQTNSNGNIERHYLQLFPNLSVRRVISETHEIGFSLSRRLDRPTYNQLNPFRFYVDPTSYRAGNPYLQPQTSYKGELTHTLGKLTTSVSYAYTSRPILAVYALENDTLVRSTDTNLENQHYYAFTLTAPLALTKWWQLHADAELFYINFNGSYGGSTTLPGQLGAVLSTNNAFTLGKGWTVDVSGTYHSREQYGFEILRSFGQVAVGVQKSLLAGRGTLRLNGTDLFYTAPVRSAFRYNVLTASQRISQDTRVATVAFSYRFGSNEVTPARKRSTGAEEEKRRAAGQ
ncbi:outer membrane beta-barrel protein [Hymenobacter sp. BT186]|uniref:Outer membrane beta-barrel protein n=1 Tax=Hymenobacter telluris TaxID=2816474 RepID=A0A939JBB4_9BACT|nr:outer membrane beta-barrel protein [Hymenobacter telluris]MBO0358961.1 outer membrane beta-barrel protein [Hymenobacter telluris]MBW3374987.1 outer membrane beta-barrel protein [Hymenobacter norwichensis]